MSHYHTPLADLPWLISLQQSEQLSVSKISALEASRRELSEDVAFGIGTGTLLVVEQPSFANRPEGCVTYTVLRCTVLTVSPALHCSQNKKKCCTDYNVKYY